MDSSLNTSYNLTPTYLVVISFSPILLSFNPQMIVVVAFSFEIGSNNMTIVPMPIYTC